MTGRSLLAALRRRLQPDPALPVVAPSYDEASLALAIEDADVVAFAHCPRQQRRTAHALSDDGGRRCFDCGFERKT
ncbi:hypothetical protein ABZT26_03130 [Streptomyces sp. NPDC005395]|uniref:hypothetical protein n=1 Tax=Streptomyces sp. NPDC005395 TaxID=3157042 RepID=UPI0033AFA857